MTSHVRVLGWTALFCLASNAVEASEPEHITVQHILIGFEGSVPGKPVARTKAQAEKLANGLFKQAKKKKANFDELVAKNTDDSPPGIYGMSNKGVTPTPGEYARGGMVPAFGNVGFMLKVGEVGLAKHDAAKSPFGYHIIKRIK